MSFDYPSQTPRLVALSLGYILESPMSFKNYKHQDPTLRDSDRTEAWILGFF